MGFTGHHRTIGITHSGKSTLQKVLAQGLHRQGVRIGVLTPVDVDGWPGEVFDDTDEFLFWAKTRGSGGERHALFVDECGTVIDPRQRATRYLATTIRHHGCTAFFTLHQSTDLPPAMRSSCPNVWVFNVSAESADDLARELNQPLLRELAPTLRVGQFLRIRPFQPLQRGQLVRGRGGRGWRIQLT